MNYFTEHASSRFAPVDRLSFCYLAWPQRPWPPWPYGLVARRTSRDLLAPWLASLALGPTFKACPSMELTLKHARSLFARQADEDVYILHA